METTPLPDHGSREVMKKDRRGDMAKNRLIRKMDPQPSAPETDNDLLPFLRYRTYGKDISPSKSHGTANQSARLSFNATPHANVSLPTARNTLGIGRAQGETPMHYAYHAVVKIPMPLE